MQCRFGCDMIIKAININPVTVAAIEAFRKYLTNSFVQKSSLINSSIHALFESVNRVRTSYNRQVTFHDNFHKPFIQN